METIVVPAPPKSAFNKNRRVSDLILHQLRHFQHVAQKQGITIDPALEREIATEGGAARYIAAVTREIRAQAPVQTPGPRLVTSPKTTAPATPSKPVPAKLDLAAAADSAGTKPLSAKKTGGNAKKTSGGKSGGKRKR